MKFNLLMIIGLFACKGIVSAQSFTLTNIVHSGFSGGFYVVALTVNNISNTHKDVLVEKVKNDLAPGHDSYFGWYLGVYPPHVTVSPYAAPISPGGSVNYFESDLATYGLPGNSDVAYCFYDQNNPSDSTCIGFNYVLTSDLDNATQSSFFFSGPSPNPTSGITTFNYKLKSDANDATIHISDLAGKEYARINLDPLENSIKIDTDALAPGIYLCTLQAGGRTLSSLKFLRSNP